MTIDGTFDVYSENSLENVSDALVIETPNFRHSVASLLRPLVSIFQVETMISET